MKKSEKILITEYDVEAKDMDQRLKEGDKIIVHMLLNRFAKEQKGGEYEAGKRNCVCRS